jgi:hypothetical protein
LSCFFSLFAALCISSLFILFRICEALKRFGAITSGQSGRVDLLTTIRMSASDSAPESTKAAGVAAARKDRTLAEFLLMLDDFKPLVRSPVSDCLRGWLIQFLRFRLKSLTTIFKEWGLIVKMSVCTLTTGQALLALNLTQQEASARPSCPKILVRRSCRCLFSC